MPQYVVRRNKKDDQIVFGAAARAIPRQPVGAVTAKMSSSGNAYNLDLIQTDIGEDTGSEYKLLFDIPFTEFRTRVWNGDRTALEAKVSYGTTTATINGINLVTEFQTADNAVGNVGIGTNVITNQRRLQVHADNSIVKISSRGATSGDYAQLEFKCGTQDSAWIWNNPPGQTSHGGPGGLAFYQSQSGAGYRFYTLGSNTRFDIDASGNVTKLNNPAFGAWKNVTNWNIAANTIF